MKAPITRKLSMRKSNGEIVESSEDEPSSSSPNSRPISRVSTTNSLHSLLNGDSSALSDTLSLPPALQAFKFYFNAFSKSLSPWINLDILDDAEELNYQLNALYLNPTEILLRKLHPNEYYLIRLRCNKSTAPQLYSTKLIQILPYKTEKEMTFQKLITNMSKQIKGAKISKATAYNFFGNIFSIADNCLFEAEIIEIIDSSEIKIAKEARIALITSSEYSDFDVNEIEDILKTFFISNQIFHHNDIFSVQTEQHGVVYFEISFPSISLSQSSTDKKFPYFIVNSSTLIYKLPKIRRLFPNNIFKSAADFVTTDMISLTNKIARVIKTSLNDLETETASNSVASILAGTPGCGMDKMIKMLADKLCVNLIKIDCREFWNIEGKPVYKLVENTLQKLKQSYPSLIVFENIKVLSETSPNNLEAGNKTLEQLCKSLINIKNAVLFTCNQSDLANLPKSLAQMIHFEFVVPDLTEANRIEFIQFWKKKRDIEIDDEKFSALTRGFVLSELDQLATTAIHISILSQKETITALMIEKAIDIRNKSFSNSIGAPKIPSVKWSDVGGLEDVKKAISESLKANLKINASMSTLKRSGIVLYGPPGCGKTLIAKAVANEFNITFLSVKGPELLNQYVGQSEQNLRMIFEKARLASPSIIFFDEMDSLAPNRGNAGDSGGVMDRMVSQLLTELDTLHSKNNCNVFVMAATNRPDLLDPCLLTPGRFDKAIHVRPAQDLQSKLRILEPVCRKMILEDGLTPKIIASQCPEIMSGADVTSLMQKAAMGALSDVIYSIEAKSLKGEEEREAIEKTNVIVRLKHVKEALKEFKGSLSNQEIAKYKTIEKQL